MKSESLFDLETIQEQLTTLEDLLVKEFRACQALQALTKDERQALASGHIEELTRLVERKEAQLDEMGDLENKRRALVQELNRSCNLQPDSATLADLLGALPPDPAGRLGRLAEGILTLLVDVRDMTHGNRAIASTALERADAIQTFLLGLYQQQGDRRATGEAPELTLPAVGGQRPRA
jgi:flagellar biosynthesis/type III secretory pathway chaperone